MVRDWERELLEVNECVAEAQFLKKYWDLIFLGPDTNKTFRSGPVLWSFTEEVERGV